MRRPWPTRGCCAERRRRRIKDNVTFWCQQSIGTAQYAACCSCLLLVAAFL